MSLFTKQFLFARLTSKSFLVPFGIVTALFLMDLSVLALFGGSYLLEAYPTVSYGALLSLYLVCVLEALGFSIFVKTIRTLLKKIF